MSVVVTGGGVYFGSVHQLVTIIKKKSSQGEAQDLRHAESKISKQNQENIVDLTDETRPYSSHASILPFS